MEKKLIRLMLDHEFWQANKHKISPTMFPDVLKSIFSVIRASHEAYQRTLTLAEVKALHRQANPAMTRAARNAVEELFIELEQEELVGKDVAKDVLSGMWRAEVGRQLADCGLELMDGKVSSLQPARSLLEGVSEDFTPAEDVQEITTDVEELLEILEERPCYKFNIATVAERCPGIAGGEFGIVFARPNQGKSCSWISLACGPGGWCEQGASVHVIVNEEPAVRSMMRCINAASGMTKEQVKQDPRAAGAAFRRIANKLHIIDDVTFSIDRLDAYCKKNRPDILVIDQLDKVKIDGTYSRTDEKLHSLYVRTREIAKIHNAAVLGLSQASAEADGKAFLHFGSMENSKTGKAAEADIIIGIGSYPQQVGQEEEDMTRVWFISKNKVNGNHGPCITILNKALSRYEV